MWDTVPPMCDAVWHGTIEDIVEGIKGIVEDIEGIVENIEGIVEVDYGNIFNIKLGNVLYLTRKCSYFL